MSWFNKGYDAGEKAAEEEEAKRSRGGKTFRWWMPYNHVNTCTFLDGDEPIVYREHNAYIDGSWKNWFTCVQGMPGDDGQPMECPWCKAGNKAYMAVAYTVVDHATWKDRKGNTHSNEPRLLIVKDGVFKKLKRQNEKRSGLTGATFEVSRGSEKDKSANTGDTWDYEGKGGFDISDYSPVDYEQELAPLPLDELERLAGVKVSVGTSGGGGGVEEDDSIPF